MRSIITARVCAFLLPALLLAACSSASQQSFVPSSAADSPLSITAGTATSTTGTIPLFQVFDGSIPGRTIGTDAGRYSSVWGSRISAAHVWRQANTSILPLYYSVLETDADSSGWGNLGHDITWWQANHPDWVLYACTSSGTPTTQPAYISQLSNDVPLDFHNPKVIDYQIRQAATYAYQQGYSGLSIDEVTPYDIMGTGVASGYYGCGVHGAHHTFVRRYTGYTDPNFYLDTIAWIKAAHTLLNSDPVLSKYHLKLFINHPAQNPSSTLEQATLANIDGVMDETGFTDYGLYQQSTKALLFFVTANWMSYTQTHNIKTLIVDKLGPTPVTPDQLEYSIATFMLANNGNAALFVGDAYSYGTEQYHPEYNVNYGTPCGTYYGGPSYDPANPQMWYRRYSNAFVAVNAGSLPRTSEVAKLPSGHKFTDLESRPLKFPLNVYSNDAYVLLTTNGCN